MGYRIDYVPPEKRRLGGMIAGWFLTFMLLVGAFWPKGRDMLANALFPGDRAVTVEALETFARDLGDGQPVGQATEDFCRRILEGSP